MITRNFLALASVLGVLASVALSDTGDFGGVERSLEKRQAPKQSAGKGKTDPSCGTINDVADKIEQCAKPLMDIIQGTLPKWPRNNAEVQEMCVTFSGSERCIREHGRRCTKGLHKTIISTLANSIQRARKRECTEAKLPALLKTTTCVEKNSKLVNDMVANASNHISAVELLMPDLDEKTNAVCCMVRDIEVSIIRTFGPVCKAEGAIVLRIYRAVLEDVIDIICRQPKCNGVFKNYKIPQTNRYDRIISTLLRIIFSLG